MARSRWHRVASPAAWLALVVVCATVTATRAAQVHVNAATGNDATGTGAAGAPFQTLTAAWPSVVSGDEVILAAGRYWYDGVAPTYAPVLTLDKHVNVTGAGAGATLLNDTRLEVVAEGGFTVTGVTIENTQAGTTPATPLTMVQARNIESAPNAHIQLSDVVLASVGVPAVGVRASTSTHVTMSNVHGVNVYVDFAGGPLVVTSSTFTWTLPFGAATHALVHTTAADVTLHRVHLSGLHGSDSGGCLVGEDLTSLSMTESTVTNCSAQANGGAVHLTGSAGVYIADTDVSNSSTVAISDTKLLGGCVHIDASHGAVLSNINVEGCIADFGGGISVATSNDVTLTSITATNSHALAGDGGAIMLDGVSGVTVSGATVTSCTAANYGGAIAIAGSQVTFVAAPRSTMQSCLASFGGCLGVYGLSTVTVEAATFHQCNATATGGGVMATGGAKLLLGAPVAPGAPEPTGTVTEASADVVLTHCHTIAAGGGIFVDSAAVELRRVLVSHCSAGSGGGALFRQPVGKSTLHAVVLSRCDALVTGGGFMVDGVSSSKGSSVTGADITATDCSAGVSGGGINAVLVVGGLRLHGLTLQRCTAGTFAGAVRVSESSDVVLRYVAATDCYASKGGGGVGVVASTNVTLEGLTLDKCTAGTYGGALVARSSVLRVVGTNTLTGCLAPQYGGCVFGVESDVSLAGTTLSRGRTATGRGGCLFSQLGAMTLDGCTVDSCVAASDGGGMYAGNTDVTIRSTTFSNNLGEAGGALATNLCGVVTEDAVFTSNSGTAGGAVHVKSGTLHITRGAFNTNLAGTGGGAVSTVQVSKTHITGATFNGNEARKGRGGGVLAIVDATIPRDATAPELTVTGATFENNVAAAFGGGVALLGYDDGTVSVQDSTFTGNTAKVQLAARMGRYQGGGGISFVGVSSARGPANITRVTFSGNTVVPDANAVANVRAFAGALMGEGCGGAVLLDQSGAAVDSCTVTGNAADFGGGVAELSLPALVPEPSVLRGNTITGNTAGRVGGGMYWVELEPPSLRDTNTINDNAVTDGYGVNVGTTPKSLQVAHKDKHEHNSGSPFVLQPLLQLMDHYNQLCTYGYDGLSGLAVAQDDTVVLSGDTRTSLSKGLGTFTALGAGGALGTAGGVVFQAGIGDGSFVATGNVRFRFCRRGELQLPDRCTPCAAGTFSWSNVDIECERCPDGAVCQGADSVIAIQNYWRMSNTSRGILSSTSLRWGLIPCRTTFSCLGAPEDAQIVGYNGTEGCAEGYLGNLCLRCENGYGRSGKAGCAQCPDPIINRILLAVALVVVFALAAVSVISTLASAGSSKSLLSMMVKTLLSFLQVVSLASVFRVDWPASILQVMHLFASTSSAAAEQMMSVDCMLDTGHPDQMPVFLQKQLIGILQPAAYIVGACIVWGLVYLYRVAVPRCRNRITIELLDDNSDGVVDAEEMKDMVAELGVALHESELAYVMEHGEQAPGTKVVLASQRTVDAIWKALGTFNSEKLTVSLVVLLFMAHPAVSAKTLQLFTCMSLDDGKQYLREDLDVECWTGTHLTWVLAVGVPSLVLWVIGIPVSGMFLLYRAKAKHGLDNQHVKNKYNFIYGGLLHEYYYWEGVIQLRKICFVAVAVLFEPMGALPQALAGLLVLFIAVLLHQMALPYKHDVLDRLERMSLVSSFLLLFFGIFFFTPEYQTESTVWIGLVLMLIVSTVFFTYWVYCAWGEAISAVTNGVAKAKEFLKSPKRRQRGAKGSSVAPSDRTAMYATDEEAPRESGPFQGSGYQGTLAPAPTFAVNDESAGFSIVDDDDDNDDAPVAKPPNTFFTPPTAGAAAASPAAASDQRVPDSKAMPGDGDGAPAPRRVRANFSGPVTGPRDSPALDRAVSTDTEEVHSNPHLRLGSSGSQHIIPVGSGRGIGAGANNSRAPARHRHQLDPIARTMHTAPSTSSVATTSAVAMGLHSASSHKLNAHE